MKTTRLALSMVFLMLLVPPGFAETNRFGDFRLGLVEGDVQIRTDDTEDWVAASANFPLRKGDRIWVPEGGRAEVQIRNGSFIRLDENSSLEFVSTDRDASQFYLSSGRAYLNFSARGESVLQIDTPGAMARAHDTAKFMAEVDRYGDTVISALKGVVLVDTRGGRTRLTSGRRLVVRDDGNEVLQLGRSDAWDRWNAERDRRYASGGRSDYLPEELREYGSEFSENGRWVYAADHGYVWTPTVQVSVGWSPYRHGRWVWRAGDYVWVSYEPWGWVPYHYGRWSFVLNIGWCWVPPARGHVYWGPGYVGWVNTPTYVAWVPLAPGEIYYGRGYYGPHSVNITNVTVNRTVVNVYRNVQVTNAVTVVHHDTFVSGRHADVHVKGNPFLTEKVHIGRPEIKPERISAAPVIREVPVQKRPPHFVREQRPHEISEQRRLVKEKAAPVIRPEVFERTKETERRARGHETPREKEKAGIRPPEHPVTVEREKPGTEEKGREMRNQKEQEQRRNGLGRLFQEEKRPVLTQGNEAETERRGQEQERERRKGREVAPATEKEKAATDNKARVARETRGQEQQKERGIQRNEEARPVPPASQQARGGDPEKRGPLERDRGIDSSRTGTGPAVQQAPAEARLSRRSEEERAAARTVSPDQKQRGRQPEQADKRAGEQSIEPRGRKRQADEPAGQMRGLRPEPASQQKEKVKEREQARETKPEEPGERKGVSVAGKKVQRPDERKAPKDSKEQPSRKIDEEKEKKVERNARSQEVAAQGKDDVQDLWKRGR